MPFALVRRRPSSARAAAVVGGVLALHLLLLLGLLRLNVWSDRSASAVAQVPVLLRLLPLSLPLPPPLPVPLPLSRPPTAAMRNQTAAPAAQRPLAPSQRAAQAITAAPPLADATATPGSWAAAQAASAASGAASTPPLDLRLRRGWANATGQPANPALRDPRANTLPATVTSRLVGAMGGDGVWHEEPMDSGGNTRVRLRRGDECVEVYKAREAQLNPFNQAGSPIPAQKTRPKPC